MSKPLTHKRWTVDEFNSLKKLYPFNSNRELAKIFNRPKKSIQDKAHRHKLNKDKDYIVKIVYGKNKLTGMRESRRNKKDKCESCGYEPKDRSVLDLHHLKPRKKGGGWEEQNIKTLCPTCHREIHLGLRKIE